jgi:hypothetical protein
LFKKTVNSWDLFDTLVGRFYVEPASVFELMARKTNIPGFKAARLQAQMDLDAIGKPYDLREVYRRFCELTNADPRTAAPALFALEVKTEMEQLIPIRAQLSNVSRGDLVITDTYLPFDTINDILQRTCGLRNNAFPPVVGNWGKHRGSIWPLIQRDYIVRCHHGDNPHADIAMAAKHGIRAERVNDSALTDWERKLIGRGMQNVALAIREVRLRRLPANARAFHHAIVGEFLAMLLLYSMWLRQHAEARGIGRYLFAAREGVHLSAVFRALMPGFDCETIDFNRRLLRSGSADTHFLARLTPESAVVDVVSSGRSLAGFCARSRRPLPMITLVDVRDRSNQAVARAWADNGFRAVMHTSQLPEVPHSVEALMDPGYPSVHGLSVDEHSRAVVRVLTPDDQSRHEQLDAEFVSECVTCLTDVMQRRALDFDGADPAAIESLLLDAVTKLVHLRHHFASPSYVAKNLNSQEA